MAAESTNPQIPYATWNTAATNIPDALLVASNGSMIIVSNGTYLLANRIVITNAITMISLNGPTSTIIKAASTNTLLYVDNSLAHIEGFTFRDGITYNNNFPVIHIVNGGTLRRCIVQNCTNAAPSGWSSISILSGSNVLVTHSSFISNNFLGAYTYYVVYIQSNATLRNSLVAKNSIRGVTASVGINSGNVISCTILLNTNQSSTLNPGGIRVVSTGNLTNNIIYHNSSRGVAISNYYVPTNIAADQIISYNCTWPELGSYCITNDPLLLDDIRLDKNSPCINAGIIMDWMYNETDLLDGRRISFRQVDIGAYEAPPPFKGTIISTY